MDQSGPLPHLLLDELLNGLLAGRELAVVARPVHLFQELEHGAQLVLVSEPFGLQI